MDYPRILPSFPILLQNPLREPHSFRFSCLECIRKTGMLSSISEDTFKIIWQRGTEKLYSYSWNNNWCGRCDSREINPVLLVIDNVLDFLTDQFQRGLQYSTQNSNSSALSAIMLPIARFSSGQHPLVTRLLHGMFNSGLLVLQVSCGLTLYYQLSRRLLHTLSQGCHCSSCF